MARITIYFYIAPFLGNLGLGLSQNLQRGLIRLRSSLLLSYQNIAQPPPQATFKGRLSQQGRGSNGSIAGLPARYSASTFDYHLSR
jgi:hypothetical protein